VTEEIPAGLPLDETVSRIREQGGLVYLPHPYDVFRRGAIAPAERERAALMADVVEVVNGRSLGPRSVRRSGLVSRAAGR
jgi:predicted metal-dependent phosphoesterase TrpH